MRLVEPGSDKTGSRPKAAGADNISDAERELYRGRLRYDQSYVRHEGPLTRLGFWHMAAALPRMVGMVLRTGWQADRRALAGLVAAQLGQGVTAGWGLVAVNSVLTQLFADGPNADKLREALAVLAVAAVAAVAAAVLTAWSTAMSGRQEPQVERAVSGRYYTAVTGVEVEATERPEVQRILEAGKFGTDSARSILRLSVVSNALFAGWPREFEAEALGLLKAHAQGGVLTQNAVFTVLLARRPGGAA
ncbi:hypothetical protein [Streptomyces sp. NPDC058731]|uniref:hypothetical protein n=1 Tax=Streptomyces sp. NPDC058731 TaxID=3346613 RepID=UPI003695F390